MDQLMTEPLLPLAKAGKALSATANLHCKTITRHVVRGVIGPGGERMKLEAVMIGGRLHTSVAAIRRFIDRLNSPAGVPVVEPRSPAQRAKASAAAEEKLKAAGC